MKSIFSKLNVLFIVIMLASINGIIFEQTVRAEYEDQFGEFDGENITYADPIENAVIDESYEDGTQLWGWSTSNIYLQNVQVYNHSIPHVV